MRGGQPNVKTMRGRRRTNGRRQSGGTIRRGTRLLPPPPTRRTHHHTDCFPSPHPSASPTNDRWMPVSFASERRSAARRATRDGCISARRPEAFFRRSTTARPRPTSHPTRHAALSTLRRKLGRTSATQKTPRKRQQTLTKKKKATNHSARPRSEGAREDGGRRRRRAARRARGSRVHSPW